ncbi:hypothetical protein FOL47_011132 [Perkinsus chesapeaki]|uniref:Uncharacterized protein n=1 Tax=Perkinsus chesapeaki TaxID=330153 RepID=A0A7J6L0Q6_PERCH|nr:hypothetical protein FOL47_011132 [Perkinsus chesapeaki]
MPHKCSSSSIKARREDYRLRRSIAKATRFAVVGASAVLSSALPDCDSRISVSSQETLCPFMKSYQENVDDLVQSAQNLPPVLTFFTDGSGLPDKCPLSLDGCGSRLHHYSNPITEIFASTISSFGIDEVFQTISDNGGSVMDPDSLHDILSRAADTCRKVLGDYFHISPTKAACGADYYDTLFVKLLEKSNDPDSSLQSSVLDSGGLPAGIVNDIPKSNILPVYTPKLNKIRQHEPEQIVEAFDSHYRSVDDAGLILWEIVQRDIRLGHMRDVTNDMDRCTFVKCAIIAKGLVPDDVSLADPSVSIRVVEQNGVNRKCVDDNLLHETPLLPRLDDYKRAILEARKAELKYGEKWGMFCLDYSGAFRNLPVALSERSYLSILCGCPDGKLMAASHSRFPFGLRRALYTLMLVVLGFPLSYPKLTIGKESNKIVGFTMKL